MKRKSKLTLVTLALVSLTLFVVLQRNYLEIQVYRMERIAIAQNSGWGHLIEEKIEEIKNKTRNSEKLMRLMLASENGTIAAEGMIYAYETIEDEDELKEKIEPFANDDRWNYWLSSNDELYETTLVAIKFRSGERLNEQEEERANSWKQILKEAYGINYEN